MQKRKSILSVMVLLFFHVVLSQERDVNVVRFNFETNQYNDLKLRILCDGDSGFYFNGSLDGHSWVFEYPRRLYEKSHWFQIAVPTDNDTVIHRLSFKQIIGNDTIILGQFTFDDMDTTIVQIGNHLHTYTSNQFFKINNRVVLATVFDSRYFLNNPTSKEYLSSVELAGNSFFIMEDTSRTYYDDRINKYAWTVRKYLDSQALIAMLNQLKNEYRTKSDVQKIFDNFSQEKKQSYYGIKIQEFLFDVHFKNSLLPAWNTEMLKQLFKTTQKSTW